MSLDLTQRGTHPENQRFTWKELAGHPTSKLDCDAFTRVRIILMNGIESEAVRFSHACARLQQDLHMELGMIRRAEQHQQTMVNWLLPADLSPLETTIAFEQVAIELTANVALLEPDKYLAQVYRFGLLEDFDHMYRFSALLDRLCGMNSNNILQSYTDVLPGRPTRIEHRHIEDELREHYQRQAARPLTKLHAYTLTASENQTHDYYMTIGPMFSDPVARQLYAEIASIEEQHTSQYESIIDPAESWLEKWLLHEATEVYNYYSCAEQETDARVRAIWERMVDYELGHLHFVRELFENRERRDAWEVLPAKLPDPLPHRNQRAFIRGVLRAEVDLRAKGTAFIPAQEEDPNGRSAAYRSQMNRDGSPSDAVAAGYAWSPSIEQSA